MDYISLSNINNIGIASSGLMNSRVAHQLVGYELFRCLFSSVRRKKGRRLSRSQRRKLFNRKRRWFTDNIIMHHKRLHDRNREIVISSAKSKVSARRLEKAKRKTPQPENRTWRERVEVRDKGRIVRGRVSARRARARSRWLSVSDISIC